MKWFKEKFDAINAWFENREVPDWKKKVAAWAGITVGGFLTLILVLFLGYWLCVGLFYLCMWNGYVGAAAIGFIVIAVIVGLAIAQS